MSITSDRIRTVGFIHGLADDAADEIEELEKEVSALKAERDAAMKDAERYRWLRDATPWTAISSFDMTRVAFRLKSKLSEEAEPDSGVELDAAIDAAIAKTEGRTE